MKPDFFKQILQSTIFLFLVSSYSSRLLRVLLGKTSTRIVTNRIVSDIFKNLEKKFN